MDSIHNFNFIYQQYLHHIYHDIDIKVAQANTISQTQGEILFPSMTRLFSKLSLTEEDVFIDFGSGVGKVVAQAFIQTNVKEAIGIEIIPNLHAESQYVANRIRKELPELCRNDRKITYLLGDFLSTKVRPPTVAFINSTCMSQAILEPFGELINATSPIRLLLTTRPIPTLERLAFKKAVRIECSWDTALCYWYENTLSLT